jgi:hypothetical protein
MQSTTWRCSSESSDQRVMRGMGSMGGSVARLEPIRSPIHDDDCAASTSTCFTGRGSACNQSHPCSAAPLKAQGKSSQTDKSPCAPTQQWRPGGAIGLLYWGCVSASIAIKSSTGAAKPDLYNYRHPCIQVSLKGDKTQPPDSAGSFIQT